MQLHAIPIVLAATLASGPALAAGDPNAARGIVAEHCSACHVVPGYRPRHEKADVGAPAFRDIAADPAKYSNERLETLLRRPHYPMSKFILSPADIDNLIAYIRSLRQR